MTSLLGRTRKHDITFHQSGKISISKRIISLLQLHEGDVIDVMHHQGEYYLYVKRKETIAGANRVTIRKAKENHNHFRAYSTTLTSAMRKACGATGDARLCTGNLVALPNIGNVVPIITKYTL